MQQFPYLPACAEAACLLVQQQQLGNLSCLFDDLDKASSEMSECPDTPLQLFPGTPTSDILMQNHFNQCLPEAPTPPLVSIESSSGQMSALLSGCSYYGRLHSNASPGQCS